MDSAWLEIEFSYWKYKGRAQSSPMAFQYLDGELCMEAGEWYE
jgi:hypothetical protein